ncbi:MAG: hypothetical protein KFF45_08450 [Thioalkalivibrio sp.]|nr:hypothetical protein [Thioalkalivibrio sp.]
MGGWGCPHEVKGECQRVLGRPCEPGMKGCVLAGRFVFSDPAKNTARVLREKDGSRREAPPGRRRDPNRD